MTNAATRRRGNVQPYVAPRHPANLDSEWDLRRLEEVVERAGAEAAGIELGAVEPGGRDGVEQQARSGLGQRQQGRVELERRPVAEVTHPQVRDGDAEVG